MEFSPPNGPWTLAFVLGLAAVAWLGHAWILLLSGRIFADVDIGWRRCLLAVFVAFVAESCSGCLFAASFGVNAEITGLDALGGVVLVWVVWFVSIGWVARLGPTALVVTALGMTGITAAFGFAIDAGMQLASG